MASTLEIIIEDLHQTASAIRDYKADLDEAKNTLSTAPDTIDQHIKGSGARVDEAVKVQLENAKTKVTNAIDYLDTVARTLDNYANSL